MSKPNDQTAERERARLDSRLSDYSAAAGRLRRRTGNWPVYAAATGSALAMATGASASVITSGIVSAVYGTGVSVRPQGHSVSSIKGLLMGSGHEVNIKATSGTLGGAFAALSLQPQARINIFLTGVDSAKNFVFGSTIAGSHAAKNAAIVKAVFSGNLYGNFISGQPGFAGLSISTVNRVNVEYGWIELVFTENAGLPYDLRALAFGIDTNPNEMIQAGQIDNGFIPEPGTMELALLAAGAAGVMALRQRRRVTAQRQ